MSKDIKYVPGNGFALAEEEDMKKLSKLAKEGWELIGFEKLCYKLKKSEPQDLIYCVDYNEDKDDIESYLEIFENSDWKHVCSCEEFHIFKAKSGTSPIYSDKESLKYKYDMMTKSIKKSVICILAAVVICFIGIQFIGKMSLPSNILRHIKLILYIIVGSGCGLSLTLLISMIKVENKRNKK